MLVLEDPLLKQTLLDGWGGESDLQKLFKCRNLPVVIFHISYQLLSNFSFVSLHFEHKLLPIS